MFLALLAPVALASVAYAADLKPAQEEAKTKFDVMAKSMTTEINAACGTKFDTIKTDFENYDASHFTRQAPGTVCSELTYDLKEICKSAPYKKALQSKIKTVSCMMKASSGPQLEVTRGGVVLHLNQDQSASGAVGINVIKAALDK
ncbi:MAG: hypothetical protein ABI321_21155 [Polyangia bacterium]